MPAQSIEEWATASRITQTFPLSAIKGAAIGVDASYYLDLRLNRNCPEPLLHALGGFPYALKKFVVQDVQALKKLDISLVFVFNGLDFRNRQQPASKSLANRKAHEDGWQHYAGGDPEKTLADFTRATYPVETLYKYLQKLLLDHKVDFMVAPYSAAAQLAHLERQPEQMIDAVMGSPDCFLFNLEKIVTNFETEKETFTWLSKSVCQEKVNNAPEDLFRDAQLLLGSQYLPTFPTLDRGNASKKTTILDAVQTLNSAGRSVIQLCHQLRDDPRVQQLQYADRYKKAVMTLKHHVVLETSGKVQPMDVQHAPGDVHEFVGQRLPEELYFYISKGMFGAQVPNWLTSNEILLSLPGGCVDTDVYRRLLRDQLNPLRTQSLVLLSNSLNRYYNTKAITLKMWYENDTTDRTITIKELPSVKAQICGWKVHNDAFPSAIRDNQNDNTILTSVEALQDSSFVPKTTSKPSTAALSTRSEITYNVLWRFLQLRGFINEKHELTSWGLALEAALSAVDAADKMEEYIFVAIEMLRLGLLNGKDMTNVPGGAERGSDQVKTMTNLVCRIACFGRLKHREIGYSGPLDRQLLSYSFMIAAVRSSLRDLVETILVSMFLSGEINRDRDDWSELAQSLPFGNENGSGLAIATRTYLDELNKSGDLPSDKLKAHIKSQEDPYVWFSFVSNYSKNLANAWKLWDAVYAGTQAAGKEIKDTKIFADTNEWLAPRR